MPFNAIVPLVMCGGAGTRLWPASRTSLPKQFLPLFGAYSTFQETIRRVSEPGVFGRPIVVTSEQYRFQVREQLAEIEIDADVLLEPERRDSGPAIAAGAEFARVRGEDPLVLALAADHVVTDRDAFISACRIAVEPAHSDRIVTFGIKPTRPATEYGYVRVAEPIGEYAFAVKEFIEKPDETNAKKYVQSGYLWNSGNFMFRAGRLLEEYRAFDSASAESVAAAVSGATRDLGFIKLAPAFSRAAACAFDYAVMEKTRHAAVVPVSYTWSDVGSWQAVWELAARNEAGNASRGRAVFVDAKGNYAASEKALLAMFGVENLVVVATDDAVLVTHRAYAHEMKRLVAALKDFDREITEDHLRVHRPWGSYQSLDLGDRYQVKRIVVKPGGRLSLQKHHHRSEHWVIVRGTAAVTVGDSTKVLHENESIYIPIGAVHRLENPGKINLELIEVQTGSYLGEDDIVRIADEYRRELKVL